MIAMPDTEEPTRPELDPPLDAYVDVQPLLRHIRVMWRFFEEVIDENPEYRKHFSELYGAYTDILNEELAPHALTLALALTELEDAYPVIRAQSESGVGTAAAHRGVSALKIAEVVTPEHGERFAKEWYERAKMSDAVTEAFALSRVVEWSDSPPAQGRYRDIEDEIMERVFDELRSVAAEAFTRIAGEVLTRERGRKG
jgi:hypothetical protein